MCAETSPSDPKADMGIELSGVSCLCAVRACIYIGLISNWMEPLTSDGKARRRAGAASIL